MKRKLAAFAAALAVLLAAGWLVRMWRQTRPASQESQAVTYYCPMHPSYTSEKPGDCPICNMKLVPMEKKEGGKGGERATQGKGKPLHYRHPMRPEITSPEPKKDEMGMDYTPVYEEEKAEVPVPGQAVTNIPQERRQLIGMKSDVLRERSLTAVVRASGRVAYDPELYNAQAEYREAVRGQANVKDSTWPDVHERAAALVRASALRLRQMGLSEAQIKEAGESERQPTNLLLGEAGGTVWVYAQIYEYEAGLVGQGQAVEITAPAHRGRKFRGVVKAVDPILSAETRSLKVRIEVPNPEGLLKLEMYVNASIQVDLGVKLALPEGALLNTGGRQLVFIDRGEGRIEPREVRVGQEAEGYYELLSGAREGERVVTSANFLIDSESKLKSAIPGVKAEQPAEPKQEHRR